MSEPTSILDLRLETIRVAQERTRRAFFLATAASGIICLIAFNWTLSWVHGYPNFEGKKLWWQKQIYNEELKQAIAREYYTIPLLGVSVTTSDLPLIGPAALVIFSFYFVTASRAGRSQIEDLRHRLPTESAELERILISLRSELVLNAPELNSWDREKHVLARWSNSFASTVYRGLVFLPFIAALLCLATEVKVILNTDGNDLSKYIYETFVLSDWVREVGFQASGLVFSMIILSFALSITANNRAVRRMVREIQEHKSQTDSLHIDDGV